MTVSWLAKFRGPVSLRPTRKRKPIRTRPQLEFLEARIVPQASRTWVSGLGDDTNPGSLAAPCKTFAGAIGQTATGGEIDALDSGGFGTLTIGHAITIDGGTNLAGVLASGTNGFVIQAAATDIVILRHLTFDGNNLGGLHAIRILQAGVVDVENCVIENFGGIGIDFEPTNAGAQLFVKNTVIRGCAQGGVLIQPNAVAASASLDHVQSEDNKFGFASLDNSVVNVSNALASGNVTNGFLASSTSASVHMNLQNDIASNNGMNGVTVSGAKARVSISDVTAVGNSNLGTQAVSGGILVSFHNNRITDNSKKFSPLGIVPGSGPSPAATRTWVAGLGDDAAAGSRTAPCKTFAGAISKTAAGGEIDVLTPGGFGAITITRAVTIDGSGSFGSILVTGTNAIVIQAKPTDVVVVRGLKLQGLQGTSVPGLNGIRILSAAAVFIENCDIQNFGQAGIDFEPTNAGCQLFVENTTVSNCRAGGVLVKPNGAANTRAMIDQVFSQFNQFGFDVRDLADVTISNSLANGNKGTGFLVQSVSNAAFMNLESDSSSNNGGDGIVAQGSAGSAATVNLSRVTVMRNGGKGLAALTKGFINSFGNIEVGDNLGGDGMPTGTLPQT
jgi:hypothetical protein